MDRQHQEHQEPVTNVHAQAHLGAYTVRMGTSSLGLRSPQVVLVHTEVRATALRQRWLRKTASLCAGHLTLRDGADSRPASWFAPCRKRGSLKRLKTDTVFWVPSSFSFFSPASDVARRGGKWCQGPGSPLCFFILWEPATLTPQILAPLGDSSMPSYFPWLF